MDLTKLPPGVIAQIAGQVEDYILNSRKRYAVQAVPLTANQLMTMEPFFPAALLSSVRACRLQGQRVLDPPFYTMLKIMGIRQLPEFSAMAAITFVDVIVSHEEVTDPLLFHELVHVVQYDQLGTKEFAVRYVNGFLQGGGYSEIPLEKHAYGLEERFSGNRTQSFSVEEEVKGTLGSGRL